jgi:hypothetical protein
VFSEKVVKKTIRASVYTTGQMKVDGLLYVVQSLRLIDDLNQSDRDFLAVTEVTLTSLNDGSVSTHELMLLNKREIISIIPHQREATEKPAEAESADTTDNHAAADED